MANKGCKGEREPTAVLSAGLRVASDLSRGMQECAIITQRCGSTVSGVRARAGCDLSGIFHDVVDDFIKSR